MPIDLLSDDNNTEPKSSGKDLLSKDNIPNITIHPKDAVKKASSPKNPPNDLLAKDNWQDDSKSPYEKQNELQSSGRNFLEEIPREYGTAGVGFGKALNEVGLGKYIPVYRDGKITLGIPNNQDLEEARKDFEEKGKGTGVSGAVADLAADPVNWITVLAPYQRIGIQGVRGAMAASGGIQALLSPEGSGDESGLHRIANAAGGAIVGNLTPPAVQKAGDYMARAVNPALKSIGSLVYSKVEPSIEKLKSVGKSIGLDVESKTAPTIRKDLKDWYDKANEYVYTKTEKGTDALRKAAQEAGLKVEGKNALETYRSVKKWMDDSVKQIADKIYKGASTEAYNPLNTNIAITNAYDKAHELSSKLYAKAEEIGAKETVNISGLRNDLTKIVNDMEKELPAHSGIDEPFFQSYRKLLKLSERLSAPEESESKEAKDVFNKFSDSSSKELTDKINANFLSDLKQAINEHYDPKKWAKKSDVPYYDLSKKVDDAIKQTSPKFQKALEGANTVWHKLKDNFDNDVIKKYWRKEDIDAYHYLTNKKIPMSEIKLETKKRANEMLDNIKDATDLESFRRNLPKEDYEAVSSRVVLKKFKDMGIDAEKINKNYDMLKEAMHGNDKALLQLDAVKNMVEALNLRYIGNMSEQALEKNEENLVRAFRALVSLGLGSKLYVAKNMAEAAAGPQNVVKKNLMNLPKALGDTKSLHIEGITGNPALSSTGLGIAGAIGGQEGAGVSNISSALSPNHELYSE